jgi:hypothetical protein
MKKLLLAILVPVGIVIGIPAIIAAVVYDDAGDVDMPVYLYNDDTTASEMLFTELDESITDTETNPGSDLVYNLNEDIINKGIYEAIKEQNPSYAPGEDCASEEACYIYSEAQDIEGSDLSFRVVGVWVNLKDGETELDPGSFVLNTYLELKYNDFSYKTVVRLHFSFEDNSEYYNLEFEKIEIGQMPIPKSLISTVVNTINEQANLNLEDQLSNIQFGAFDLDNLSYTLQKDEILAQMDVSEEDDSGAKLTQELLAITFEQQYVLFEIVDGEIVVEVALSQLSNDEDVDIPEYLYDLHDQTVEGDTVVIGDYNPDLFMPEEHLQNMLADYLFNSTLTGGNFEIGEEIFNKLIYDSQSGFTEMRKIQEIPISETESKEITFGLRSIWFEIDADAIYVHALFQIGEVDSLMIIRADEVSSTSEELVLEFTEITVGKDEGESNLDYLEIVDMETFKEVFADLGDVEFGYFDETGNLIITAERLTTLMQDASNQDALVVQSIDLVADAITLDVSAGAGLDQVLEDFQTALQDAIEDDQILTNLSNVLDETDGGAGQAIYDSIENIQDALNSGDSINPEDIGAFVDGLSDLDSETQNDVLESFTSLIDSTILDDFETSFGALTDSE